MARVWTKGEFEAPDVRGLIYKELLPVEKSIEYFLKDLIQAQHEISLFRKRNSQVWKDVFKALKNAEQLSMWMAQGQIGFPPEMINLARGYTDAVRVASASVLSITAAEHGKIATLRLADAMSRLGTFYSGKFGLAMIGSSPLGITIFFDDLNDVDVAFEQLGAGKLKDMIGDAAEETEERFAQVVVKIMREKMRTIGVPAVDGRINAPITNTGQMAGALGLVKGNQRVYSRGRIAANQAHSITVGVKPGSGRVNLYANVLAKSTSSRAPGSGPIGFSRDTWGRIADWARERGIPDSSVRYIVAKIWNRGTYGRRWMAYIVQNMAEIEAPDFLVRSFAEKLERFIEFT